MAPSIIEGIDNEVLFVVSVLVALATIIVVHLLYKSNVNRHATQHESNISSDPNQEHFSGPDNRTQENPRDGQGTAPEVDPDNDGLIQASTSLSRDNADEGTTSQPINDTVIPQVDRIPDGVQQRRPTESSSNFDNQHATPGDLISIRIKFMENERNLSVNRTITVGELKRLCFMNELNSGRRVRLIYSGRLLQDESAPASFYGVTNCSVIHAQISDARRVPDEQSGGHDEEGLIFSMDPSKLFVPLLALILILCWYGLFYYRHLFSAASVIILVFMTLAFGFLVHVVTS